MIDYLPFSITNKDQLDRLLPALAPYLTSSTDRINQNTGLIKTTKNYRYKCYNISVLFSANGFPLKADFKGSIHKLFNEGIHNANRFTVAQLEAAIYDLCYQFSLNPQACKLLPFEFGINIKTKYEPAKYVRGFMSHRNKRFNYPKHNESSVKSGGSKNNYILKVYSKSEESPLYCDSNILRIEFQQNRMRDLNRKGIVYLSDLLIQDNLMYLSDLFLNRLKDSIFFDWTIYLPLRAQAFFAADLANFANPHYWDQLSKSKIEAKQFRKQQSKLIQWSANYGENIFNQILEAAELELMLILNVNNGTKLPLGTISSMCVSAS